MSGQTGSVALFLRDLPPDISRKDLLAFVRDALRSAGLRGMPLIKMCSNCQIMRIIDPTAGTVEYHGLIEIQPARIVVQAIAVLNGRELAGHPIEVRRYRHRSSWGEHRRLHGDPGDAERVAANPLVERRRENLKIDLVDATPPLSADLPTADELGVLV